MWQEPEQVEAAFHARSDSANRQRVALENALKPHNAALHKT